MAKAKPALIGFFESATGLLIQKRVEPSASVLPTSSRSAARPARRQLQARANAKLNGNTCSTHVATHVAANGQQNGQTFTITVTGSNEPIASTNVDVSVGADPPPLTRKEILDAWHERMVPLGFPAVAKMTGQRETPAQGPPQGQHPR
jgi:hypothetical protein